MSNLKSDVTRLEEKITELRRRSVELRQRKVELDEPDGSKLSRTESLKVDIGSVHTLNLSSNALLKNQNNEIKLNVFISQCFHPHCV